MCSAYCRWSINMTKTAAKAVRHQRQRFRSCPRSRGEIEKGSGRPVLRKRQLFMHADVAKKESSEQDEERVTSDGAWSGNGCHMPRPSRLSSSSDLPAHEALSPKGEGALSPSNPARHTAFMPAECRTSRRSLPMQSRAMQPASGLAQAGSRQGILRMFREHKVRTAPSRGGLI